jgi:uncharacterized membrane protein
MQNQDTNVTRIVAIAVGFVVVAGAVSYFVTSAPDTLPPSAPPAPAAGTGGALTDSQRATMRQTLKGAAVNARPPVWFVAQANSPDALALQRALQEVFDEAGWEVRGNTTVGFPIKPGLYVFIAEEEPPAYARTALAALEGTGMPITAGVGYRAFYADKKRENPNWNGFDMAADQSYVVVVGRPADK